MEQTPQTKTMAIDKLERDAQTVIFSPKEIDEKLREIANIHGLNALGSRFVVNGVAQHFGDEATVVLQNIIEKTTAFELHCDGDEKTVRDLEKQVLNISLLEMMRALWGHPLRNQHGGLSLKQNEVIKLFAPSVKRLADRADVDKVVVIFIDLDNFKAVNDSASYADGDQALGEAYALMHKMVRKIGGIAFFDGGDEYIVIIPEASSQIVLEALWSLRVSLRKLSFGTKQIKIDMTAGVQLFTVESICENWTGAKSVTTKLLKNNDDQKRRATVIFNEWLEVEASQNIASSIDAYLKLGVCISRSRYATKNLFGDARLNFLSQFITQQIEQGGDINLAVDDILKWLDVDVVELLDERPFFEQVGLKIPYMAVAIAILHGVVKGSSYTDYKSIRLVLNKNGKIAIQRDELDIWGQVEEVKSSIEYGQISELSIEHKAVVGVQIGFHKSAISSGGYLLPSEMFANVVSVDIRPRTGGGLPDFWQVAVAEVVSTLFKYPMCNRVLIWGELPETSETAIWLSGGHKDQNLEEVAAITNLPIKTVESIVATLQSRTLVVSPHSTVLDELYSSYLVMTNEVPLEFETTSRKSYAKLLRPMAQAATLRQEEAMVCTSAAEAYPIIIDTLRRSENTRCPKDDSNQELSELLAFKLKLTSPLVDKIPTYLLDQKSKLDKYADAVLLNDDGLIREKLEATHQVTAFTTLLANYLKNLESGKSTRRACLVVPNEVGANGELKPLGLFSVWATPIYRNSKRFVDFVFVWRTVEAFIGLPYSLYGSIQMAEQLVKASAKRNNFANQTEPQLGELTYIAMSLHLGNDNFHSRIAKRIVDLASD